MSANNGTGSGTWSIANCVSNSYVLDNGVEVEESVLQRSPLVRTLSPVVGFFRSRAGSSVDGIGIGLVLRCTSDDRVLSQIL